MVGKFPSFCVCRLELIPRCDDVSRAHPFFAPTSCQLASLRRPALKAFYFRPLSLLAIYLFSPRDHVRMEHFKVNGSVFNYRSRPREDGCNEELVIVAFMVVVPVMVAVVVITFIIAMVLTLCLCPLLVRQSKMGTRVRKHHGRKYPHSLKSYRI